MTTKEALSKSALDDNGSLHALLGARVAQLVDVPRCATHACYNAHRNCNDLNNEEHHYALGDAKGRGEIALDKK